MNRRDFLKRSLLGAAFLKLGGLFSKSEGKRLPDPSTCMPGEWMAEGEPLPPLNMETIEKALGDCEEYSGKYYYKVKWADVRYPESEHQAKWHDDLKEHMEAHKRYIDES